MRRDQSIPREAFQVNDRIRAYIYDVRRETKGPQIMLSRAHGGFMAKLFAQEVPEIYDGVIEIKSVARDPGSRAKMAVLSNDSSIDPVGACVGMRGSRVQAVVAELQNEKIDIIQWSPDEATFIVNALAPAEVSKVVLDEEDDRVEVVVPDEQLSLAIGRRGQNVRLASQLTGWQVDIITEAQDSERRQKEFARAHRPCSRKRSMSTRLSLSCWLPKGSAPSRIWPMSTRTKSPSSKASTRKPPRNCRRVRATSSSAKPLNRTASARNWASRTMSCRSRHHHADGRWPWVKPASRRSRIWPTSPPMNCAAASNKRAGNGPRVPGALESFSLSVPDAENLILNARIALGWIEAPEPEAYEDEETDDVP